MSGIGCIMVFMGLLGAGQPGTAVMPLLRIDQGPRFAAMGGAGIGAVDDASAIYWNPAGLGRVRDQRFALSHHQWFTDIKDEILQGALSAGSGAFGLGLVYSGEPGIESWDATNFPGDTFSTWDGVLSAGYGFAVARNYHLGVSLKGFYQDLSTSSGYGGAADIGFACRPSSLFGFGVVGRNIGAATYGEGLEPMPTEAGIGGTVKAGPVNGAVDVVLALDGLGRVKTFPEMADASVMSLRLGAEYQPVPELAVRVGYRTGPQDIGTLGRLSGLTAGLGVNIGVLSIDYAIAPYGVLGTVHRIGLQVVVPRTGRGSVSVKVVDARNMEPLAAGVSASGVISYKGSTGRMGEAELTRLPAGDLVIATNCEGYIPRVDTMFILGDREQTAIIALTPLSYGGIIGAILDAGTSKSIGGSVVYRGPQGGQLSVEPGLGGYALRSIPSGVYYLTASGPTDDYVSQTCTLKVEPGRIASREFYLVRRAAPSPLPSSIKREETRPAKPEPAGLQSVSFESGKAEIPPAAEAVLAHDGELLKANPDMTVELAGHTDPSETTSTEYPSGWELSQARAEAVKQYLVAKFGIAAERMTAHGYADTQPIASNDTEKGRAQNRRTEFRITGQ